MPSWFKENLASAGWTCESLLKSFMADLFSAFEAFVICHVYCFVYSIY